MNTTDKVEALPTDVAVLAAESDFGPHALTCLPKRLGGWIGAVLIFATIPMTWAGASKIMTAIARNTYGWDLVLYGGSPALLLFMCARILDPRIRRARFYGFARGFILRNSRLQLTDVSWAEIVRVRRISASRGGAQWYEMSERGGSWIKVNPSFYRRSYEVDTYMARGARARRLKIEYR
jgi:hypothetical protein